MASPTDRVYTETHEWLKVDGDTVTLGLTQFAVDQLTDVTYVEMRDPGTAFDAGDPLGEVESVKTTSDVYSPVPGEIVAVNSAVVDDPSVLNSDPYDAGWLVKFKMSDDGGLASCSDGAAYDAAHGG